MTDSDVILAPPSPGAVKVWYWINFTDLRGKFLGAVIVHAADPASAIKACWHLHVNPGGSPYFVALEDWAVPPRKWRNRLLSQRDCDRVNGHLSERLDEAGAFVAAIFGGGLGYGIHAAGGCQVCADPDFGFDRHVYSTLADEV